MDYDTWKSTEPSDIDKYTWSDMYPDKLAEVEYQEQVTQGLISYMKDYLEFRSIKDLFTLVIAHL